MSLEQEIDRELKAALSVTPTDGFEARVLERVDADRERPRTPYVWWAAAAAAVLVTLGAWQAWRPSTPAPDRSVVRQATPAPSNATNAPAPAVVQDSPAPVRSETSRQVRLRNEPERTVRVADDRRREADVIVRAGQMDAVGRFLREINSMRLAGDAQRDRDDVAAIVDLTVTPLTVDLITVPAVDVSGAPSTPKGIQ